MSYYKQIWEHVDAPPPYVGSELLSDGNFESWINATLATYGGFGWLNNFGTQGSYTISNSTPYGYGSACGCNQIGPLQYNNCIAFTNNIQTGTGTFRVAAWLKSVSGNNVMRVIGYSGFTVVTIATITTSWAPYVVEFFNDNPNTTGLNLGLANTGSFVMDDVSFVRISPP
jgi:hypothetical protein